MIPNGRPPLSATVGLARARGDTVNRILAAVQQHPEGITPKQVTEPSAPGSKSCPTHTTGTRVWCPSIDSPGGQPHYRKARS